MSDIARVRESLRLLRRESDRFVAELAALTPAQWDRPSVCAPWTVRLLAAHVARQVDSYIGSVEQGMSGVAWQPESREARAARMNEIAALEIAGILDLLRSTNDRFEAWFSALTPEQLDVAGPHSHGPRSAAWFVDQRLAEVAFHRLDLERSLADVGVADGVSPDLDQETARFLLPMLLEQNVPAVVARDETGGRGTFALRVRGEPAACWRLEFSPGTLDVTPGSDAADVVFEADASALALVMYGRASWQELERAGRLTVSGDRAAAAPFHTLFKGP